MTTARRTTLYSIMIAVSVLALIFLGITAWLMSSTYSEVNTTPVSNLTSDDVYTTKLKNLPDPLITMVPKDQQSPDQKTKVFISSEDPLQGNTSAQVFVILYGSLTDTTTQTYLAMATSLMKKYDTQIAVVWKDYAVDDFSETTAVVAHCANDFGKFWQFTTAVPNRSADTTAALLEVAATVGLDKIDIQDCIDTKGYAAQIQQSYYTGKVLGVTTGHSLFVNDRLFIKPLTQSDIEQSIDEILASY